MSTGQGRARAPWAGGVAHAPVGLRRLLRRRRWHVVAIAAAALSVATSGVAPLSPARAQERDPLGLSCTDFTGGPVAYTKCSGMLPSFDGVPIDSDLTVPLHQLQSRLPLI